MMGHPIYATVQHNIFKYSESTKVLMPHGKLTKVPFCCIIVSTICTEHKSMQVSDNGYLSWPWDTHNVLIKVNFAAADKQSNNR